MNDTKKLILAVMASQEHCVIATTNQDGAPEAAVVGFSANDNLELLIGTSRLSRKYQNFMRQPRVAVVVHDGTATTVQYEGIASLIPETELASRLAAHYQKIPAAVKHQADPNEVYLSIKPVWIRYSDYAGTGELEELKDFA